MVKFVEAGLLGDINEHDWSAVDKPTGGDRPFLDIHHRGVGWPTRFARRGGRLAPPVRILCPDNGVGREQPKQKEAEKGTGSQPPPI